MISPVKTMKYVGGQALCAFFVLSLVTGCTAKDTGTATQGYKGVINLEGIKLGTPEESAKSALLTFVPDPNVPAPFSQYLSRTYDQAGGQYCLSYKEGTPKQLRIVYAQQPISKSDALAKLKNILPSSAPEETKVDDSEVKSGKKDAPVELHFFGDNIKGEIIYSDKAANTVKVISVMSLAKPGTAEKPAAESTGSSTEASGSH